MSNTVVPFFHLSIFAHLLNVFVQDTHTQLWFKTFYYNKRTRLRQSYTYSHITDSWNCIHKTFIVLNLVKYVCACLLFIHENENICEYEWRVCVWYVFAWKMKREYSCKVIQVFHFAHIRVTFSWSVVCWALSLQKLTKFCCSVSMKCLCVHF